MSPVESTRLDVVDAAIVVGVRLIFAIPPRLRAASEAGFIIEPIAISETGHVA